VVKTVENLFGKLFLINSQHIFGDHRRLPEQLIARLDEVLYKCMGDAYDVEIDRSPEETFVATLPNGYESCYRIEKS
jgi:hypothetical protein